MSKAHEPPFVREAEFLGERRPARGDRRDTTDADLCLFTTTVSHIVL